MTALDELTRLPYEGPILAIQQINDVLVCGTYGCQLPCILAEAITQALAAFCVSCLSVGNQYWDKSSASRDQ